MNKINGLFGKELKIVNLGVKAFYDDLKSQEKEAVHVAWKPPAGGDKRLQDMLKRLK